MRYLEFLSEKEVDLSNLKPTIKVITNKNSKWWKEVLKQKLYNPRVSGVLKHLYKEASNSILIIAAIKNIIVGAGVLTKNDFSVYVKPLVRRMGIGTKLVNKAKEVAYDAGIKTFSIYDTAKGKPFYKTFKKRRLPGNWQADRLVTDPLAERIKTAKRDK